MVREKKEGCDTLSRKRSANRLRQLRESTVLTGQVVTLTRKYCLRLRAIRALHGPSFIFRIFSGCSGGSVRALFYTLFPHCPFLVFLLLINFSVRPCAASVYSLINGASALVSGNYTPCCVYIHRETQCSNSIILIIPSLSELKRKELGETHFVMFFISF